MWKNVSSKIFNIHPCLLKSKSMKKSEEIKQQINNLELEYQKALLNESKLLLHDNKWTDDMIGLFDMGKTRLIFNALCEGKILLLEHSALGNYIVKMNVQRNRILVECLNNSRPTITEDNIINFIVWNAGMWYTISNKV